MCDEADYYICVVLRYALLRWAHFYIYFLRGRKNTGFRDAIADVTKLPSQLFYELKKLAYPIAEEQIAYSQPNNPQHNKQK